MTADPVIDKIRHMHTGRFRRVRHDHVWVKHKDDPECRQCKECKAVIR